MPALQQLISFHIIEQDKHDQILMTWTYPSITETNKTFILNKIPQLNSSSYVYLRNKKNWIYVTINETNSPILPDIQRFYLILIAKECHPIKYEKLGRIFSKCYLKTGNPVELIKPYLSVFTTGACSTQENGVFISTDYDKDLYANTKVKEFINAFGLEIILIYTAILLKKRVAIYHHTLDVLLKRLQSVVALVPHRNPNEYLYPWIECNHDHLLELKGQMCFVAGFTDSAICSKNDFYDLLVNLPALEINVMSHAKEGLSMTKIHKDIAISMVQMAENDELSDGDVTNEIQNRTSELLNYLRSFSTITTNDNTMITVNDLKSKILHINLENFLFNLAVAENLMMF